MTSTEKDVYASWAGKNGKTLQNRNYTNESTKNEQENTGQEEISLHTNNLTS